MKKDISYPKVESASRTCEAADWFMLGSLLTVVGAPVGALVKYVANENFESALDDAREIRAATEAEADSIAESWLPNHPPEETKIRIVVEQGEVEVAYTYTAEEGD